jgi:diguanylate cyclase
VSADGENACGEGPPDGSDFPLLRDETPERAAEYFRLALQQINRYGTPLVPLNYALFYFYVSGSHQLLNEKMDNILAGGSEWQHDEAAKLFLRHLTPCNDLSMSNLQQDLLSVVNGIIESTVGAGHRVDQYSDSLDHKVTQLTQSRDPKQARQVATEILHEARSLAKESKTLASEMQTSAREVEKLKEELIHARREASVDALTGLQNRRTFDVVLTDLVARNEPFGLIIMDVDHFKEINDQHGHLIGDRVLRQLAKLMSTSTRTTDTVTRYGGEEFAILLPRTRLQEARKIAEKLCATIGRLKMRRTDNGADLGRITASFGVAEHLREESGNDSVARADEALYKAKRSGRNRVEVADPTLEKGGLRHSA